VVVTRGAVQNALARCSPVSLAKLDLSHLASSGSLHGNPALVLWNPGTSFGTRAWR